MRTTSGPVDDGRIPPYLPALGIPGLADIDVHFLPEPMLRKVWDYFDQAKENYGQPWPIRYRFDHGAMRPTTHCSTRHGRCWNRQEPRW